ncbi:hypothetical protein ACFP47_10395 [Nesterenkonia lacusekhoensis]|uniref:Transcriptional regulator with XRE-family HTH domain n=1 Tax=Nesterenkonia lacusekhoensis TaxID=150832 RepID=A0ABS4T5Q0_9MICC|nr:hypothetical protein [Nesterenkonia lacusekhoensis]MBP2319611.1 transcriptional regulator with XRE-family HTH domain [Nesterenkonia lacusekhoensis]
MDARDLTYRAVAENAQRQGYKVSHATVTNYVKGKTRAYTRDSLIAIAAGIGVPAEKLLSAADMQPLGELFELPEEAALLDPHEREAVRSVVNAFLQSKRQRAAPALSDHAGGLEAIRRHMERTGQLDEEVASDDDSTPMYQAAGSAATEDPDDYDLAADDSLHQGDHGQIGPDDIEHTT